MGSGSVFGATFIAVHAPSCMSANFAMVFARLRDSLRLDIAACWREPATPPVTAFRVVTQH